MIFNILLPLLGLFGKYHISCLYTTFITYIQKFRYLFYRPSLSENLQQKHQYFEFPDIDTKINRQNFPHYRLQNDLLQDTQIQYNFSEKLTLNDDIIPQIEVFARSL